jgi:DNA-binding MarR family transcriptional regulator
MAGISSFSGIMSYNLSESATYLSSLLARGFSRSLLSRAAELGFSPGQFPVLIELWNEDGLTQREILDRLEIEQATLANTLARMERDGLIRREPHPRDKRAIRNFLTDKGRKIESEAVVAAEEADQALFKGFRRFEKELMLEYMRWAIENARRL